MNDYVCDHLEAVHVKNMKERDKQTKLEFRLFHSIDKCLRIIPKKIKNISK